MNGPVLRLDDIIVLAGGRAILDVATFAVAAGETVALLGPNGAGKTTFLHVAGLLRQPDSGAITILGETATIANAATLRRALSVVFQAPLLFDVNVLANAAAGLRFQGVSRAEAERRAGDWLAQFAVAHLAKRRARALSGGEAGRVALARAFATEPAILLLDEPFAALDAPTRASLLPELRQRLRDTSAAAVLVSHDLAEAFSFGDRLALMQDGRIQAQGDASDLVARPPSRAVAALLGIETILAARVTNRDGGLASLALQPEGPMVRVQVPVSSALVAGQEVTFTLPAAATRLLQPGDEAPPGWNSLTGRVTAVAQLPLGACVGVATPARIVAFAPWSAVGAGWRIGDGAVVVFSPGDGHVISEAPS